MTQVIFGLISISAHVFGLSNSSAVIDTRPYVYRTLYESFVTSKRPSHSSQDIVHRLIFISQVRTGFNLKVKCQLDEQGGKRVLFDKTQTDKYVELVELKNSLGDSFRYSFRINLRLSRIRDDTLPHSAEFFMDITIRAETPSGNYAYTARFSDLVISPRAVKRYSWKQAFINK